VADADRMSDEVETYNPWTVVNLVFSRLAAEGLHPVLGSAGDPSGPATDLLRALGITPSAEGNRQVVRDVRDHLATMREAVLAPRPGDPGHTGVST
jgi:hypothetical protein